MEFEPSKKKPSEDERSTEGLEFFQNRQLTLEVANHSAVISMGQLESDEAGEFRIELANGAVHHHRMWAAGVGAAESMAASVVGWRIEVNRISQVADRQRHRPTGLILRLRVIRNWVGRSSASPMVVLHETNHLASTVGDVLNSRRSAVGKDAIGRELLGPNKRRLRATLLNVPAIDPGHKIGTSGVRRRQSWFWIAVARPIRGIDDIRAITPSTPNVSQTSHIIGGARGARRIHVVRAVGVSHRRLRI